MNITSLFTALMKGYAAIQAVILVVEEEAAGKPSAEKKQLAIDKVQEVLASNDLQMPDFVKKIFACDGFVGLIIDLFVYLCNKMGIFQKAGNA